ncbi:hypothetical protein EJ03DRAFT_357955 [Teratosphaeria nubilosa]|uniref:Uncharacterized protein n=1 Tax=Teratosphaeria nubilosa TaxID=161662 RepID=A0A6G1LFP9_9PEZI|nr:hypothetical protein EJ03DRAFT_357955 [Teratosphaeria nubilosa]
MQSYSHQPHQQYYHQQHLSEIYQHQPVYATPASMDTPGDEPQRKKHKHDPSPEPPSSEAEQVTTIEDPLYLRQQIIDNSIALMHVLCPAAYGPHNQSHWTLVMLLRARNPDIWRAGVAADGLLVIEGPDGGVKAEALNLLFEAISAKLARSVKRSWLRQGNSALGGDDGAEAETGLEEDGNTGARFASERREASR